MEPSLPRRSRRPSQSGCSRSKNSEGGRGRGRGETGRGAGLPACSQTLQPLPRWGAEPGRSRGWPEPPHWLWENTGVRPGSGHWGLQVLCSCPPETHGRSRLGCHSCTLTLKTVLHSEVAKFSYLLKLQSESWNWLPRDTPLSPGTYCRFLLWLLLNGLQRTVPSTSLKQYSPPVTSAAPHSAIRGISLQCPPLQPYPLWDLWFCSEIPQERASYAGLQTLKQLKLGSPRFVSSPDPFAAGLLLVLCEGRGV